MKLFVLIFSMTVMVTGSYYVGRYNGRSYDRFNECGEKIQAQIMANKDEKHFVRTAPFQAVYYYVLGRTFECAAWGDR